jgi:hypothetical protein
MKMKNSKIALWVRIWVLLMALLPLGFVMISYANPGFFGQQWALAGPEKLATVFGHYTGRNLSMGVMTLVALAMGRAQGMILMLGLRIVTDLMDSLHQTLAGTINLVFVVNAGILIIGSLVAIKSLWPVYKSEGALTEQTPVSN